MDPDEFSDPIVIPITITLPNPFPRRHSGRFDLGPSYHPSFKDPTWFARQRDVGPPHYTPAQLALPFPLPPPITLPHSKDEITQTLKEMREMWARARRRAGHVEEEIGRGDYGSAAGHLLGGQPYPAGVDNGFILNNEGIRSPDLDALTEETERDLERRLNGPLDERHPRGRPQRPAGQAGHRQPRPHKVA